MNKIHWFNVYNAYGTGISSQGMSWFDTGGQRWNEHGGYKFYHVGGWEIFQVDRDSWTLTDMVVAGISQTSGEVVPQEELEVGDQTNILPQICIHYICV